MQGESNVASHTGSALRALAGSLRPQFEAPLLSDVHQIVQALEGRCARAEGVGLPTDIIEASYEAAIAARRRGAPVASMAFRDLRWLPFALFHPRAHPASWLASDTAFVHDYLRWIAATENRGAASRLLRAFMLNYPEELGTFEVLRNGIAELLSRLDSARIRVRREWARRHYVLVPDGPKEFTAAWKTDPEAFAERFSTLGRDGELSLSRFGSSIEREICRNLTSVGSAVSERQFIVALHALSIEGSGGRAQFRNPDIGVHFTDAILSAFTKTRPQDRLRLLIRQGLVDRLGDPRLPGRFAAWSRVSPSAIQVMRRWLVDDTLRVFFEVISESLQESPEKKLQWEGRRQFWTAYLDDISDAWVALSSGAEIVTGSNEAFRNVPHGRMSGANANSVLLMAIDDLLVVEFSHLGGVRYWPPSDEEELDRSPAPELFKERYGILDFKVPSKWNIPHQEGWQAKVRKAIRDETGIRGRQ